MPVVSPPWGQEQKLREVRLFVQGCTAHKGLNWGSILGLVAHGTVPHSQGHSCQGPGSPTQGQGPGGSCIPGLGWELIEFRQVPPTPLGDPDTPPSQLRTTVYKSTRESKAPDLSATVTVQHCVQTFRSPRRSVSPEGEGGSASDEGQGW